MVEEYKGLMGVEFARWAKANKQADTYLLVPEASPPTMNSINLQYAFENEVVVWPILYLGTPK